jgi:tRNA dimethylallyltransferase
VAPVPDIEPAVRQGVRAMPRDALAAALAVEDPLMAARLRPSDPQRMARALEVVRATGRSLADWQALPLEGGIRTEVALRTMVLDPVRDWLTARIDQRVAAMWAAGALDEVRALLARGLADSLPVMRAIGVPPLKSLIMGQSTEVEAMARWRLETRRYAKRQHTWFRTQAPGWVRIAPDAAAEAEGIAGLH